MGGISSCAKIRDIDKLFKKHGRITNISLKPGYAFIEYEDLRDAERAIFKMNGFPFLGYHLKVEKANGKPHGFDIYKWLKPLKNESNTRRTIYRVKVENLSNRVKWQELKDLMRVAGYVKYVECCSCHHAIVHFNTRGAKDRALKYLNGKMLYGKKIKITEIRKVHFAQDIIENT